MDVVIFIGAVATALALVTIASYSAKIDNSKH